MNKRKMKLGFLMGLLVYGTCRSSHRTSHAFLSVNTQETEQVFDVDFEVKFNGPETVNETANETAIETAEDGEKTNQNLIHNVIDTIATTFLPPQGDRQINEASLVANAMAKARDTKDSDATNQIEAPLSLSPSSPVSTPPFSGDTSNTSSGESGKGDKLSNTSNETQAVKQSPDDPSPRPIAAIPSTAIFSNSRSGALLQRNQARKKEHRLKKGNEVCIKVNGEACCCPIKYTATGYFSCIFRQKLPQSPLAIAASITADGDILPSSDEAPSPAVCVPKACEVCHHKADCIIDDKTWETTCKCHEGFDGNGIICVEPGAGQCADPALHQCDLSKSKCTELPNGYICECFDGYRQSEFNNRECIDINECTEGTHQCSHLCENTPGGYQCVCPSGFRYSSQNQNQCIPIDECKEELRNCDEYCTSTSGSYDCTCGPGFRTDPIDKNKCIDINECTEGTHNCLNGATCKNTHGSYECLCDSQKNLVRNPLAEHECMYDCSAGQHNCGDEAVTGKVCKSNADSYICACKSDDYLVNAEGECVHHECDKCIGDSLCHISEEEKVQCVCQTEGHSYDYIQGMCVPEVSVCKDTTTICPLNSTCENQSPGDPCTCVQGFQKYSLNGSTTSISANSALSPPSRDRLSIFSSIMPALQLSPSSFISSLFSSSMMANEVEIGEGRGILSEIMGNVLESPMMSYVCVDVNECHNPLLNTCDAATEFCFNLVGGFYCFSRSIDLTDLLNFNEYMGKLTFEEMIRLGNLDVVRSLVARGNANERLIFDEITSMRGASNMVRNSPYFQYLTQVFNQRLKSLSLRDVFINYRETSNVEEKIAVIGHLDSSSSSVVLPDSSISNASPDPSSLFPPEADAPATSPDIYNWVDNLATNTLSNDYFLPFLKNRQLSEEFSPPPPRQLSSDRDFDLTEDYRSINKRTASHEEKSLGEVPFETKERIIPSEMYQESPSRRQLAAGISNPSFYPQFLETSPNSAYERLKTRMDTALASFPALPTLKPLEIKNNTDVSSLYESYRSSLINATALPGLTTTSVANGTSISAVSTLSYPNGTSVSTYASLPTLNSLTNLTSLPPLPTLSSLYPRNKTSNGLTLPSFPSLPPLPTLPPLPSLASLPSLPSLGSGDLSLAALTARSKEMLQNATDTIQALASELVPMSLKPSLSEDKALRTWTSPIDANDAPQQEDNASEYSLLPVQGYPPFSQRVASKLAKLSTPTINNLSSRLTSRFLPQNNLFTPSPLSQTIPSSEDTMGNTSNATMNTDASSTYSTPTNVTNTAYNVTNGLMNRGLFANRGSVLGRLIGNSPSAAIAGNSIDSSSMELGETSRLLPSLNQGGVSGLRGSLPNLKTLLSPKITRPPRSSELEMVSHSTELAESLNIAESESSENTASRTTSSRSTKTSGRTSGKAGADSNAKSGASLSLATAWKEAMLTKPVNGSGLRGVFKPGVDTSKSTNNTSDSSVNSTSVSGENGTATVSVGNTTNTTSNSTHSPITNNATNTSIDGVTNPTPSSTVNNISSGVTGALPTNATHSLSNNVTNTIANSSTQTLANNTTNALVNNATQPIANNATSGLANNVTSPSGNNLTESIANNSTNTFVNNTASTFANNVTATPVSNVTNSLANNANNRPANNATNTSANNATSSLANNTSNGSLNSTLSSSNSNSNFLSLTGNTTSNSSALIDILPSNGTSLGSSNERVADFSTAAQAGEESPFNVTYFPSPFIETPYNTSLANNANETRLAKQSFESRRTNRSNKMTFMNAAIIEDPTVDEEAINDRISASNFPGAPKTAVANSLATSFANNMSKSLAGGAKPAEYEGPQFEELWARLTNNAPPTPIQRRFERFFDFNNWTLSDLVTKNNTATVDANLAQETATETATKMVAEKTTETATKVVAEKTTETATKVVAEKTTETATEAIPETAKDGKEKREEARGISARLVSDRANLYKGAKKQNGEATGTSRLQRNGDEAAKSTDANTVPNGAKNLTTGIDNMAGGNPSAETPIVSGNKKLRGL